MVASAVSAAAAAAVQAAVAAAAAATMSGGGTEAPLAPGQPGSGDRFSAAAGAGHRARGNSALDQPAAAGQPQAAATGGGSGGSLPGSWRTSFQDLLSLFLCRTCCESEANAGDALASFDALQANIPDEHDCHTMRNAFIVAAEAEPHVGQPGRPGGATQQLRELPEMEVRPGQRYKGQWRGQLFHGIGVYTRDDGSTYRYEGMFENGQEHGRGKCVIDDLEVYEGQMQRGKAHGQGIYMHEDGSTYEGEWVDGNKEGMGIERWSDGSRYEGQFVSDLKDGVGVYYLSTGDVRFKGQFRKDKMDGEGMYYFQGGGTYDGQWQAGRRHGIGVIQAPGHGARQRGRWHYGTMVAFCDREVATGDGEPEGNADTNAGPPEPFVRARAAPEGRGATVVSAGSDTDLDKPSGPTLSTASGGVGTGLRGAASTGSDVARSPAMVAAGGQRSSVPPACGPAVTNRLGGTGDVGDTSVITPCAVDLPETGPRIESEQQLPARPSADRGGTTNGDVGSHCPVTLTDDEGVAVHAKGSTGGDSGTVTVDVDKVIADNTSTNAVDAHNRASASSATAACGADMPIDTCIVDTVRQKRLDFEKVDGHTFSGSMAQIRRIMADVVQAQVGEVAIADHTEGIVASGTGEHAASSGGMPASDEWKPHAPPVPYSASHGREGGETTVVAENTDP